MHSSKKNALLGLKEISKWLIICVYNEEKIYLSSISQTLERLTRPKIWAKFIHILCTVCKLGPSKIVTKWHH